MKDLYSHEFDLYKKNQFIDLCRLKDAVIEQLFHALTATHQKYQAQSERQQEELFLLHSVIENLPGSIYWKSNQGVYLGRNKYSQEKMRHHNFEHTDSEQDEIIGKTDLELFGKEIANVFFENDKKVLTSGEELVSEETVVDPDGKDVTQMSTKRPLRNKQGQIIGLVGNTVDITHLKDTEKALRQAKEEQAEQANVHKTEFIQNMEHDIRTPLNGILGLAEYLYDEESEEKKEYLKDIKKCAAELLSYCNGILDFSKCDLACPAEEKIQFSLRALVQSILVVQQPIARDKKLILIEKLDAHLPEMVIGDQYRLYRIMINLISNAIKFTEKGSITISVQIKQEQASQLKLAIEIIDTGIGIPQHKIPHIYDSFVKVSQSNRRLYKGLGLGLQIVKQFVSDMSGDITVSSELGQGSIFTVYLWFDKA